jgi:hypothetical protein
MGSAMMTMTMTGTVAGRRSEPGSQSRFREEDLADGAEVG